MPEIEANKLSKSYGTTVALKEITFNCKKGDLIGLLGANGAGKSTLIKVLAGVIFPSDGDALLSGCSIRNQRQLAQSNIGYLPESPSGYDELTVSEFLAFSAASHGLKKQNLKDAVARISYDLELESFLHKQLVKLSKGLRQRAWLAQALVHNPKILFLDEPTDGLDPIQKISIRKYIKFISKEKTIIMSTHILEEAEAICEKILIINRGKLIKNGKIGSFLDNQGNLEPIIAKYAV